MKLKSILIWAVLATWVSLNACSSNDENSENDVEEETEVLTPKNGTSANSMADISITWPDGKIYKLKMDDDSGVMAGYTLNPDDAKTKGTLSIPIFLEDKDNNNHNITIGVELNGPGEYRFLEEHISGSGGANPESAVVTYGFTGENEVGFSTAPFSYGEEETHLGSSVVKISTLTKDRVKGTFSAVLFKPRSTEKYTLQGSFDMPVYTLDVKALENNPLLKGALEQ